MHSTASDGALPPDAVVAAARAAGVSAIALTDHDTMAGVAAAREAGARLGIRVVAGAELSAHEGDREVHVLGLHVSPSEAFESRLTRIRATRVSRAEQIVDKLNALGVHLHIEDVLAEAGAGAVGRPHVARAMIARGWAMDSRDAFDRYLGYGRPAYVDKERLPIEEAIRLIHEAGGLAVLAHPGSDGTRQRVERLAALGLDGLEVRHPSHTADDATRLLALCDHFRLVPSGGSDWHGAADGPRTIGCMRVPEEWLERQDAALAARGPRAHVA
jgi:predicted metal-dependent phosphoesterase TrpH